ncbi:MAG: CDC48 family AAA ATPase [Halobacteriota archaeon]
MELLVGGLDPRDGGRGIARLSESAQTELGVEPGGVVTITDERTTVGKVLPSYAGDETNRIRIDGTTRANARTAIDELVRVEPAAATEAETVTVAFPPTVSIHGAQSTIHRLLVDRPVLTGDAVQMALLGHPLSFLVTETDPDGPVLVTAKTDVRVRDRPVTEADFAGERTEGPLVTYEDIGGLGTELAGIREMIELPLRHPELFRKLGIAPPKGVLLYGPPGTGKTLIAKAVANEVDATFVPLTGPEIMSKYYGESEQHLRDVFDEAEANAPAIVFIDEIDSIAPKREEVSGEVERRVVAQLLALMDGLEERGDVVVIAATNRVNAIDPALRRGGRFDREIEIGVPDRNGRLEILQIHTRGMPLAEGLDLDDLADRTYGFVGADLESLAKEAAMSALRRIRPSIDLEADVIPPDVLDRIEVTPDDFEEAMGTVEPSAMREVFVEIPTVTYDDVGGLQDVKAELVRAVEWPLSFPRSFERLHADPPKGLLLYGPPGTGKTLLAKAVANESQVNFISVKGPELLDKYVGESERAVREVFHRARQAAPTIVFFDEVDALAPERGSSSDSHVTERVVSQLLTELDGIESLANVVVIGATNRPDIIDPALLRSGRLEKRVFVPAPDDEARHAIFEIHTRGMPLDDDVDVQHLAAATDGYVGSDIESVCREASMLALDEFIRELGPDVQPSAIDERADELVVTKAHFETALDVVSPSLQSDQKEFYERLADELGGRAPGTQERHDVGFQ